MRHAFEFHDATLHSVRVDGSSAVLAMNVCVHASEGEPGVDSGSSWFQDAEVVLSGLSAIEGASGEGLDWDAYDGNLLVDGERFDMVPIPFDRIGDVRLGLLGARGEGIVVRGSGIRVAATGEPGPVERF